MGLFRDIAKIFWKSMKSGNFSTAVGLWEFGIFNSLKISIFSRVGIFWNS